MECIIMNKTEVTWPSLAPGFYSLILLHSLIDSDTVPVPSELKITNIQYFDQDVSDVALG